MRRYFPITFVGKPCRSSTKSNSNLTKNGLERLDFEIMEKLTKASDEWKDERISLT